MKKTWLYHPELPPQIFEIESDEQLSVLEGDGWRDSPAKCEGFLDKVGVDPDNAVQVQYVAEVTEQTVEAVNLMENLDTLEKPELLRLASLQFSEDWSKKRMGVDKLRAAIKKRLNHESRDDSQGNTAG